MPFAGRTAAKPVPIAGTEGAVREDPPLRVWAGVQPPFFTFTLYGSRMSYLGLILLLSMLIFGCHAPRKVGGVCRVVAVGLLNNDKKSIHHFTSFSSCLVGNAVQRSRSKIIHSLFQQQQVLQ